MQQVSLLLLMFMLKTDRFDGKNVVEVPVADGIKRPEELINKALDTSRKPFVARDGQKKR